MRNSWSAWTAACSTWRWRSAHPQWRSSGRSRRRARGPLDPTRVCRILVVRLDLLGDLVLSMPAVRALRTAYPEARIDLLTSPYAAPVAALFPAIDEVIALDVHQFRPSGAFWRPRHYRDLLRVVRRLRRARYDLAISLH